MAVLSGRGATGARRCSSCDGDSEEEEVDEEVEACDESVIDLPEDCIPWSLIGANLRMKSGGKA